MSEIDSPYPPMRPRAEADQSANTSWTQTRQARRARAIAVSCMPKRWLDTFDAETLGSKRFGLALCNEQQQQAWRDIVDTLKAVGLLSPTTGAVDVDVPRMVREALQIIRDLNQ
jgi:hypothetical protein